MMKRYAKPTENMTATTWANRAAEVGGLGLKASPLAAGAGYIWNRKK